MPKIIILTIGLLLIGAVAAGGYYFMASQKSESETLQTAPILPTPSVVQGSSIEQVKETNEESLLAMEGVEKVEVGEKDGKPCVVVFTFKETDELQNLENNGLDGYEVKIENTTQNQR